MLSERAVAWGFRVAGLLGVLELLRHAAAGVVAHAVAALQRAF